MRCYFLRPGRIAGVEILPLGLSDEDAVARAHALASKRKGPFDGLEVWDGARSSSGAPRRRSRLRPASRTATRLPICDSTDTSRRRARSLLTYHGNH
jgi:hypothetical protein